MEEVTYPMHKGAKTALYIMCGLLVILCATIPLAAYFLYRVQTAGARLRKTGLTVRGLGTVDVEFDDIERLGLLSVPVGGAGLGRVLAVARVGGEVASNLVIKTKSGKNEKVIISQFDQWPQFMEELKKSVRVPCEDIQMGALSWKWPDKAA